VAKPKLHELLAVEPEAQAQFNKVLAETLQVMTKKAFFAGSITTFVPFDEAFDHLKTEEHESIATTVPARLDYTAKHATRYLDVVLQKELTNQTAVADLEVDGQVIAEAVPATFLLGLETKLKKIRQAIEHMPTLDNKAEWVAAPQIGDDVFEMAHSEERFRTKKETKAIVLYEALIKDGVGIPAQIREVTEDTPWGKVSKTTFSGAVTSARKAEILGRIDKLTAATKKARQRANCAEVVKRNIGDDLFKFILG